MVGQKREVLQDHVSPFFPQQFSLDIADNASTVCLAHLFTYQDFDEGTLGLAYVAPSKPQALGGLCPKRKGSVACNAISKLLSLLIVIAFRMWFSAFDAPSEVGVTKT